MTLGRRGSHWNHSFPELHKFRILSQSYRNVAFIYILEKMNVLPLGLVNSEPSRGGGRRLEGKLQATCCPDQFGVIVIL